METDQNVFVRMFGRWSKRIGLLPRTKNRTAVKAKRNENIFAILILMFGRCLTFLNDIMQNKRNKNFQ